MLKYCEIPAVNAGSNKGGSMLRPTKRKVLLLILFVGVLYVLRPRVEVDGYPSYIGE
jgi:hypothetical protein